MIIENIPMQEEEGISAIAFAFKDIVDEFGDNMQEIAMDSTCMSEILIFYYLHAKQSLTEGKTNALGYEFYAIVGEANGQAVPFAFVFTASTDGTATSGTKDRMLRDVIGWVSKRCPNITFTLSDKDTSEINAFRHCVPDAKHQLCYWHAIRYLEARLAEDKPPAAYDPRKAHSIFDFIDPTWAPGVTIGWLEEGVHEHDVVTEQPLDYEGHEQPTEVSLQSDNNKRWYLKTCSLITSIGQLVCHQCSF
jgi:hypothetical protein